MLTFAFDLDPKVETGAAPSMLGGEGNIFEDLFPPAEVISPNLDLGTDSLEFLICFDIRFEGMKVF